MKSDYIHVKKFISDDIADLLYGHVLLAHRRLSVMLDDIDFCKKYPNEKIPPTLYGTFDDPQALGDLSRYGDLIFDTLLLGKTEQLEQITETGLIPQYSYYRLYTKNAELKKHKDRESCEISLTMCLGYDAETSWPIWFKDKDGNYTDLSPYVQFESGENLSRETILHKFFYTIQKKVGNMKMKNMMVDQHWDIRNE